MINALDPEKASYLKDAKAAIEAYDALTDSQKADSRFTTDVLNKLNAAKDAVEAEEEIKDVIKMISELDPESETYVEDAKEAVSAYNALSDAQKADSRFEDEGVAENLDAAEKVVKSEEEIEKVLAMIKILDPNSPAYGVEAMLAIEAFNALTPEQQNDGRFRVQEVASVIADAKAAAATEKDKEAAQPVIDQINALNEKSTKAEVEAARKAFDALKPSEQAACGSAIFKLQGEEYRIYSTEAKAKKVKKFKAKNLTGKKAKLTWNAVSDVDGYRITYKANGVKTKKIMAGASEIKKTIKKLKKGKKYTFTIQPYNNVYNPITAKTEKVYGKKSTKKVKIRK